MEFKDNEWIWEEVKRKQQQQQQNRQTLLQLLDGPTNLNRLEDRLLFTSIAET